MQLSFGLSDAIPETVTTAWGARAIFPNDLVFDRQDMQGDDRQPLTHWLNSGALKKALETAGTLRSRYKISSDGAQRVILHSDKTGVIVASPRSSCGYLYIAAWLHDGAADKQPGADFA